MFSILLAEWIRYLWGCLIETVVIKGEVMEATVGDLLFL